MLGIKVAIPNLTVARLEQFQPLQLRNQSARPTDVKTNYPLYEIAMLSTVRG